MIKKSHLNLWISLLLAAGMGTAVAEDTPPTAVVMLKSDVGAEASRQIAPEMLVRLQEAAGAPLQWVGNTRTHAQILQLPAGMSRPDALGLARKLAAQTNVLWAELEQKPASDNAALSEASADTALSIHAFVVKLKQPDPQSEPAPKTLDRLSAGAGILLTPAHPMTGAYVFRLARPVGVTEAIDIERRLEALPDVAYADPVLNVDPLAANPAGGLVTPNDPRFPEQWHLLSGPGMAAGSANVQAAWSTTQGSDQIAVAVLDSGILFKPTHPDLKDNLRHKNGKASAIAGWDMISSARFARDGNPRDKNPKDEGDWLDAGSCGTDPVNGQPVPDQPSASNWHGSHVAGIIGATADNGIGVSGINWFGVIEPVRVIGACSGVVRGTFDDVADGIYWAAGNPYVPATKPNPMPARVINMSLGKKYPTCPDFLQAAIDYALFHETIVVVAAGNDNGDAAADIPANCRGALVVGAVGANGDKAPYSNWGEKVFISAPGGAMTGKGDPNGILSTVNASEKRPRADGMTYDWQNGTSMAAPVVSGVISLMLGRNPKMPLSQIRETLQWNSRAFPEGSDCAKNKNCGVGIIDADLAVKASVPN